MQFILWSNGTESTPLDLATVQQSIQQGKISPKVLARLSTGTEWRPLETLLPKKAPVADSPIPEKKRNVAQAVPEQNLVPADSKQAANQSAKAVGTLLIIVGVLSLGIGFLNMRPGGYETFQRGAAERADERNDSHEAERYTRGADELSSARGSRMLVFCGIGAVSFVGGAAIRFQRK